MSLEVKPTGVGKSWLIQRGEKQFAVKSTKLLLAIYHEGRLSPSDKIQESPTGQWILMEAVDWTGLESPLPQAKQTVLIPTASSKTKKTENPTVSQNSWWNESSEQNGSNRSVFLSANWKWVSASICLIMACSVLLLTKHLFFVDVPSQMMLDSNVVASSTGQNPNSVFRSEVPSPNSNADSIAESSSVPKSPTSLQASNNEGSDTDPSFAETQLAEKPSGLKETSTQQAVATDTSKLPELDQAEQISASVLDNSISEQSLPAVSSNSENDAVRTEMKDPKGDDLLLNDSTIKVESKTSLAQTLDQKSEEDKIFDQIMANVTFYKNTSGDLQKSRSNWQTAFDTIEKLKTKIGQNELLGQQGASRIQQIQNELASAYLSKDSLGSLNQSRGSESATRQSLIFINEQIRLLNVEGNKINSSMQRLVLDIQNKNREIQRETQNINLAERSLVDVCQKEEEATKRIVDLVDFFDERPLAVHRRIHSQALQLVASEPDFFLGYLMHSAASIRLNEFAAPSANLATMRTQSNLLSKFERNARSKALQHFEALALALNGLSQHRQSQHNEAVQSLKFALKIDHASPEILLVRGIIGMDTKGRPDGISYFRKAIEFRKQDARMYRVPLSVMVNDKEIPDAIINNLLSEMVKRAPKTDMMAMMIAAEASERLKQIHDARQYLGYVTVSSFDDRKRMLSAKLDAAKSDADVSESAQ